MLCLRGPSPNVGSGIQRTPLASHGHRRTHASRTKARNRGSVRPAVPRDLEESLLAYGRVEVEGSLARVVRK